MGGHRRHRRHGRHQGHFKLGSIVYSARAVIRKENEGCKKEEVKEGLDLDGDVVGLGSGWQFGRFGYWIMVADPDWFFHRQIISNCSRLTRLRSVDVDDQRASPT